MVDYYEELSLMKGLDLKSVQEELVRLESVWRRREITNPEKAAKMIALIIAAQEKFRDEQSRKEYDLQLAQNSRKPSPLDTNVERQQDFMEWQNKAVSFYDEKQYDLAKSALEKALSYMPADYEDSAFFNQAALIYVNNNDCNPAMDYVNKAIINDSNNPNFYLTKGLVFNKLAEGHYYDVNATDYQTKSEEMFLKAHDLAVQQNMRLTRANAAGALAVYYNYYNAESRAETFAQEAVDYGETWGNGQKVLDMIKSRKEAREQAQQKQMQREKEEHRIREEEKRRVEEQKQEQERHKREHEAAMARRRNLYIVGWLVWVVCQAVNGPIFFYSRAFRRFITTPLFLILSVIGTTVPAFAEAAYLKERGVLGGCCIFSIIMYCVYTQYIDGVGFFALLISLAVLQFISWVIGCRKYVSQ